MSNTEYLKDLLINQKIPSELKKILNGERNKIHKTIKKGLPGVNVKIFNAGSYAKGTMILDSFDLDIVVYYPSNISTLLEDIQEQIFCILNDAEYNPYYKNVAIRCNRKFIDSNYPNFHIDVVPGKSIKNKPEFAYLYNRDYDIRFRTSVQRHVKEIKKTKRCDLLKLIKIWKVRHKIDVQTFVMEMLFIRFMKTRTAKRTADISDSLQETFDYIGKSIFDIKLVDPANSQNIISDLMPEDIKHDLRNKTIEARDAEDWQDVFFEDSS